LNTLNHFQTVKPPKIESGDFVKGDDTIKIYIKISSVVYPLIVLNINLGTVCLTADKPEEIKRT